MLTILNRRELCITRTIESQAVIRDILQQNDIEYKFSIIDHNNYFGSEILTKQSYYNREILYRFYVNKKDYEKAIYLIKDVKR